MFIAEKWFAHSPTHPEAVTTMVNDSDNSETLGAGIIVQWYIIVLALRLFELVSDLIH